ncbi:MAG: LysR family transcriptional regulator [Clostridium sp.]
MLEELKTFIAVVECLSFTKASERINISQPAVSKHIKNLEELYGIKLIERSIKDKKIAITLAGEHLYRRGKQIIRNINELYIEIDDFKNQVSGEVKIGASYTIGEYYIPEFLSIISKKYPKIEFEIIIDNTKNICRQLHERKIDIGLVEGSFNNNEFYYGKFKEDELYVVSPYDPTINNKEFRGNDFENSVWISREEGSGTREQLDKLFSLYSIRPKKIMYLGSNCAIKEGVKYNLGVSLLSKSIVKDSVEMRELSIMKVDSSLKRRFHYITRKEERVSKAISVIIDTLLELN